MKFKTPASGSVACCLFGSYKSGENDSYSVYIQSASPSYFRYADGRLSDAVKFANDTMYELEMSYDQVKLNGNTYNTGFTRQTFTTYNKIHIGWINTSSSAKLKGKLYYFEVVGKAKLYPCKRISDDAVGMYETVSQKFYPADGDLEIKL